MTVDDAIRVCIKEGEISKTGAEQHKLLQRSLAVASKYIADDFRLTNTHTDTHKHTNRTEYGPYGVFTVLTVRPYVPFGSPYGAAII